MYTSTLSPQLYKCIGMKYKGPSRRGTCLAIRLSPRLYKCIYIQAREHRVKDCVHADHYTSHLKE